MNDYDEIINSSQQPKKFSNNWFYVDDCDEKDQEINKLTELLAESLELLEEKEKENELLREKIKNLKLIPKDSSFVQNNDEENLNKINEKILKINEKLENFIEKN